MRIAICDDEDQERLNIKALVKRYAPELSIVLFSSADELLTAAKTTFFPLIFLDIEIHQGLDIIRNIRYSEVNKRE